MPVTILTQSQLKRANWFGLKKPIARALTLPLINDVTQWIAPLLLPNDVAHRLPVRAANAVFQLESGSSVVLLNPRADLIAKDICWGKGSCTSGAEQNVLRWLERHVKGADLFLDIGAYSGLFSLVAAKAGAKKVVAFEIVPDNYLLLLSNVIANDEVSRIEARLCAIGQGFASIRIPSMEHLASLPTSVSLSFRATAGVEIPVRDLDSFDFHGKMIWKIDVETFEWNVIQSGDTTIRKHRPDIICEILPSFEHSHEVGEFLQPLGYRFFISLDRGLEERPSIVPDPEARDWIFMVDSKGGRCQTAFGSKQSKAPDPLN